MIKLTLVCILMVVVALDALSVYGKNPKSRPVLPLPAPSYTPHGPSYEHLPREGNLIKIVRLENDAAPDGSSFQYLYETENGISAQETGSLVGSGNDVALGASGSFQWTSPEGVPVRIDYIADENGYQPAGNLLPTPPPTQPIPEAILRSIEYNLAHPEPSIPGPVKYYRNK